MELLYTAIRIISDVLKKKKIKMKLNKCLIIIRNLEKTKEAIVVNRFKLVYDHSFGIVQELHPLDWNPFIKIQ